MDLNHPHRGVVPDRGTTRAWAEDTMSRISILERESDEQHNTIVDLKDTLTTLESTVNLLCIGVIALFIVAGLLLTRLV